MSVSWGTSEIISRKKALYGRYIDTKQWDKLSSIALSDAELRFFEPDGSLTYVGRTPLAFTSPEKCAFFFQKLLGNAQTLHMFGRGELEQIKADEVRAIWPMEDRIILRQGWLPVEVRGGGYYSRPGGREIKIGFLSLWCYGGPTQSLACWPGLVDSCRGIPDQGMNKYSTKWTAHINEANQEEYVSYVPVLGLHLHRVAMAALTTRHSAWKGYSQANAPDKMANSLTFGIKTLPNFEPRVVLRTQSSCIGKTELCT